MGVSFASIRPGRGVGLGLGAGVLLNLQKVVHYTGIDAITLTLDDSRDWHRLAILGAFIRTGTTREQLKTAATTGMAFATSNPKQATTSAAFTVLTSGSSATLPPSTLRIAANGNLEWVIGPTVGGLNDAYLSVVVVVGGDLWGGEGLGAVDVEDATATSDILITDVQCTTIGDLTQARWYFDSNTTLSALANPPELQITIGGVTYSPTATEQDDPRNVKCTYAVDVAGGVWSLASQPTGLDPELFDRVFVTPQTGTVVDATGI